MLKKINLLICLVLLNFIAKAQTAKQKEDWFILGFGQGYKYFEKDMFGKNFGGAYFFNNYKNFYKRAGIDITYNPNLRRTLNTINLGFGEQVKNKYITFNINAGPSFFWGKLNSNRTMITLGLSAQTGIYYNILPDLAIGVEGFTNANFIQSTHGFRICIMGMQPVR